MFLAAEVLMKGYHIVDGDKRVPYAPNFVAAHCAFGCSLGISTCEGGK